VGDDPHGEAALQKWLDQKDALLAGRKPRSHVEGLTVGDLCNLWLDWKAARVATGELSHRTIEQYKSLARIIIEVFGRERAADDPGPEDFAKLRDVFSKRWGPGALGVGIIITRSIWNWGYQDGKLKAPQQFGAAFSKPGAKAMRQQKLAAGPRMFDQEEVKSLLAHASVNMRAMLLLGLQAGIGNTDLALAPIDAADLVTGWLTLPRAKTAIPRRVPLWPETVTAIRDVLAHRPTPKPEAEHLLFVTPTGISYLGNRRGNAVWQEFQKAATAAGVTGRTYYDCRRTFATVADGAKDPVAVSAIMGHAPKSGDMASIYRQRIEDDRLVAVVDVVHRWLYGDGDKPGDGRKPDDRRHGREGAQQATESTRVQTAVIRCLQAIEAASGPDKAVLQSVWNSSEIALALAGEHSATERFLRVWGDDRPALRVVG
jgi:integrase